jgi:hypothetical protein
MRNKGFILKDWSAAIIVCIILIIAGVINGESEYSFGAIALNESDCPAYYVSIDGEICYYDFDRLDWVEPHFMGCYYHGKDSDKPFPDAIGTDHGWK